MEYYSYDGRRIDTKKCRGKLSRKRVILLLALLSVISVIGVFYQMAQEERLLKESWSHEASNYSTDCEIAVAMGTDIASTRGLYASMNSIIANYHGERKLCFFVFSKKEDILTRTKGLECLFGSDFLPSNIQIIHKEIRRDEWDPVIYSRAEVDDPTLLPTSLEYMYARYYMKTSNIDGMRKVIWIDADTIVRGDIQELYDWDLRGKAVAGANYWEPLKEFLCHNPRLDSIKMRTRHGRTSPFQVKEHLNTGLLVIDLYQLYRQRTLHKWHALVSSHELDCLWTQPDKGFHLALNGQYEELPNAWNVGYLGTQEYHRYNGACEKAKLLHWNGIGKPYNEGRGASLCVNHFDMYDLIASESKEACIVTQ